MKRRFTAGLQRGPAESRASGKHEVRLTAHPWLCPAVSYLLLLGDTTALQSGTDAQCFPLQYKG